jgi:predicted transcriptional regulator
MLEKQYRASRTARVLGNPSVYAIVEHLLAVKRTTPTALARRVGRNLTTVSNYLKSLKLAEVVRWESDGYNHWYRIKYPGETRAVMKCLGRLAEKAARGWSARG